MFCTHCGKEVADDQQFCHHCGARLREAETVQRPAEAVPPPAGDREKTPWEDRETAGFFNGLFKTLGAVLFRPSEFFRKMPVSGGLTDPLLYALIVGMVGLMFSYLWQILTRGALESVVPIHPGGHQILQGAGLALLAFFSPFILIIGLFLSAGILHLCLMMVKGTTAGFEGTFRVVGYGYSANIFMVVPFCGGLLAAVWAVILYVIGLREAHETTGGKAAFAVFLPAIVCCGLVFLAIAFFLSAAALSFGSFVQMHH